MAKKKADTKKDLVPAKSADIFGDATGPLNAKNLALLGDFDTSMFKDVGLDVSENKELFENDILIPKIWLTQPQSEAVLEQKVGTGCYVDSKTLDVLADAGAALRFVVLKTFKRRQTFKMVYDEKAKKEVKDFVSGEIITYQNMKTIYQETIDGVDHFRREVISAYVLIERDFALGNIKPYIIDFVSSSKGAGRTVVSEIATLNNKKLPSIVGFFEMTSKLEKFDQGSAFVKEVKFGGILPKESMPFLIEAYKTVPRNENEIMIDDSDILKDRGAVGETVETKVVAKASAVSSEI